MRIQIKSNIYLFIALTSVLLFPIHGWAALKVHIILTIDGGNIAGESIVQGREGTIEAVSAGFNVFTPIDSTGSATGARVYRPFTILKLIDKSSPLLFKALVLNETVTLEAMYFRVNPMLGIEEKFMTILLENARIVGVVQTSESFVTGNEIPMLELVSFVFQQVTMTYELNGNAFSDTIVGGK